MPVTRKLSESIGKLFRNLREPIWYATEAAKTATSVVVLNPLGQRVNAFLFGHLYHPELDQFGSMKEHHVADVYKCGDQHEYLKHNGTIYRFNPTTHSWVEL